MAQRNVTVSSPLFPAGSGTIGPCRNAHAFRTVVSKPAAIKAQIVRYVCDAQPLLEQLLNEQEPLHVPGGVRPLVCPFAQRVQKAMALANTNSLRPNSREIRSYFARISRLNFNQW